ncbi:MAG: ubiquitin carboxyl-terminal hydrolase family protein [Bacteroidota bacterium]
MHLTKKLINLCLLSLILSIHQTSLAKPQLKKTHTIAQHRKRKNTKAQTKKSIRYLLPIGCALGLLGIVSIYHQKPENNQAPIHQHIAQTPKPSPQTPCGLANLVNTCFINAILQCLAHVPQIREYVRSGRYKEELLENPGEFIDKRIAPAFFHLLEKMYSPKETSITPTKFINIVQGNPKFANGKYKKGEQNDASDFLINLLNQLHEALRDLGHHELKKIIEEKYQECTEEPQTIFDEKYTFMSQMRAGIAEETTTSKVCNHEIKGIYQSDVFAIKLPHKDSITLKEALVDYYMKEDTNSPDCFFCDQCKLHAAECTKITKVNVGPSLCIIIFKRSTKSDSHSKNKSLVQFPMVLNQGEIAPDKTYDLIGVVNHIGATTENGHYTACVKSVDNHWYTISDSQVEKTDPDTLATRDTMILFYKARP